MTHSISSTKLSHGGSASRGRGVGAAGSASVEADQPSEGGQTPEEELGGRIVPVDVEGAEAAGAEHEVDRAPIIWPYHVLAFEHLFE
jgi:hypothetical protein